MHIFYSFIFQVLSQAAGLDWNKKTSNSNDEAGKQTIGNKNLTFEIQTQLSNEGLQNGWWLTSLICQNAKKIKGSAITLKYFWVKNKNKMVASLIQCLQNQKKVSKFLLFRAGKDCKILSAMVKQNSKTKHNILIYEGSSSSTGTECWFRSIC